MTTSPTRFVRPGTHKGYQALHGAAQPATTQNQVVAAEAETALDEAQALHIGSRFETFGRVPQPEQATRRLDWRTGLNPTRGIDGKAVPNYAGWAVELPTESEEHQSLTPDDEFLIATMETLYTMQHDDGAKYAAPIVVQHKGDEASKGKPRYVQYCALSRASLYVVCEGIPSNTEMRASVENRWGVAYAWPTGGRSTLRFQCFIKEFIEAGYFEPFLVSVDGQMTDLVLSMLRAQQKVLAFADKLRQAKQPQAPLLPFFAYDLPTAVSGGTRTFGKAPNCQEVYYPVPLVGQVDLGYLKAHRLNLDVAALIEDDGRVERVVEWSVKESRRIAEVGDDVPPPDDGDAPGVIELDESPF